MELEHLQDFLATSHCLGSWAIFLNYFCECQDCIVIIIVIIKHLLDIHTSMNVRNITFYSKRF